MLLRNPVFIAPSIVSAAFIISHFLLASPPFFCFVRLMLHQLEQMEPMNNFQHRWHPVAVHVWKIRLDQDPKENLSSVEAFYAGESGPSRNNNTLGQIGR